MNIREMRALLGDTQSEFALRYNIPLRTIQNWETSMRKPPKYVIDLLNQRVKNDSINGKTISLPKYDQKKINLPKRSDYVGALSWLKAINDFIDEPIVFALDEALMCQGSFNGRSDENIIWVYGDNSLTRYNEIVVIGNHISKNNIKCKNGLYYTNFNRTVYDALVNESILDMQGILEAISKYYYSNNESFDGIFIAPEYQEKFEKIAKEAIEYYSN